MRDYTKEDRQHRERLEKNSSAGVRANVVDALNRIGENDDVQRSAADVLLGLRKAAQGRARTVREMNARHDALQRGSNFETWQDDPGQREPSRFDQGEQFDPTLTAGRISDAAGSMATDARTRDHWDGQGVHPQTLSLEQMRSLAAAQVMARRYW